MSKKDLVVLSGAHSIGEAHCSSFKERYTKINESEIDPTYADSLREQCKYGDYVTVSQDHVTSTILDNQYYNNMNKNEVLFFSDWALRTDGASQLLMNKFATIGDNLPELSWQAEFGAAMQKLGNIIELRKGEGEIRKVCNAVNTNY